MGNFCKLCGATSQLTKHHILPKGHPERYHKDYITILCEECHSHYSRLEYERGRFRFIPRNGRNNIAYHPANEVQDVCSDEQSQIPTLHNVGDDKSRMVSPFEAKRTRYANNVRGRRKHNHRSSNGH